MVDDEELEDSEFFLNARVERSSETEFAECTVRDRHEFLSDEPESLPVGAGLDAHPSPMDFLVVALTTCQVSVLSQCLERARVENYRVVAEGAIDAVKREDVPEEMPGNTRTRIDHVSIDIDVEVPEEYESRASRCLEVYDQGCIVGQSIRAGVPYTPETTLDVR